MGEPIAARLEAHLARMDALIDELAGNWAAFFEVTRQADRIFATVRSEAEAGRISAGELLRLMDRVRAVKEHSERMVRTIQQSAVGGEL